MRGRTRSLGKALRGARPQGQASKAGHVFRLRVKHRANSPGIPQDLSGPALSPGKRFTTAQKISVFNEDRMRYRRPSFSSENPGQRAAEVGQPVGGRASTQTQAASSRTQLFTSRNHYRRQLTPPFRRGPGPAASRFGSPEGGRGRGCCPGLCPPAPWPELRTASLTADVTTLPARAPSGRCRVPLPPPPPRFALHDPITRSPASAPDRGSCLWL